MPENRRNSNVLPPSPWGRGRGRGIVGKAPPPPISVLPDYCRGFLCKGRAPPVAESGAAPSPQPPPPEGRGSIGAETPHRCRRTGAIPTSYPPPLGGGAGGGVSSGRVRRRPFRFCPTFAEESSAKGARRPLKNPARPPPPTPSPGGEGEYRCGDAAPMPENRRNSNVLPPSPWGRGQGEGYRREGSAAAHFGFARHLPRIPLQRGRYGARRPDSRAADARAAGRGERGSGIAGPWYSDRQRTPALPASNRDGATGRSIAAGAGAVPQNCRPQNCRPQNCRTARNSPRNRL